jgi:hypothetical protein
MAVDTPARIAVLGAGPIGLEAALYARFLGYDVDVFERGRVCEHLLQWGHVRLFSPFGLNRSTLGLAALHAQCDTWQPPDDASLLTGRDLAEGYYLPLAQSDLLVDHIQQQTEVLAIARDGLLKGDQIGDPERREVDFRILTRDANGQEKTSTAAVVIDATGTFGQPNGLGSGGLPAAGERDATDRIEQRLPDVLGKDRSLYAGKRTLVIGAGYSAATSIVALDQLAKEVPETRVVWITRDDRHSRHEPIARIPHDSLDERDRLAQQANQLASDAGGPITHWPGTTVQRITAPIVPNGDDRDGNSSNSFEIELAGGHADTISVDRIIANVGYRPDNRLHDELQVQHCYATDGPMKLAAALAEHDTADCLDQRSHDAESLVSPEADFYILGSKSYGRSSNFLLSVGLEQIRQIFTIIGESSDLDLYRSVTAMNT